MDPLVLLALSHAPEIGRWVLGGTDGKTAAAVTDLVRAVTGSAEAADAQKVIGQDVIRANQLRLALAKLAAEQEQILHQADFDELKKQIADVAGAKTQAGDLAKGGSGAAWGGLQCPLSSC